MRSLRVGVIGAGSWTRICHIPCLQADERVQVVALCGRRVPEVSAQAAEFGISQVYTDYKDLIASSDIDAVTIATPNVQHYPIAIEAIFAGKHVFCEKPLTMNINESASLLAKANQGGIVHQVAFTFRHLYATNMAKQMISEGAIGTLYRVAGFAEGKSGLNPNKPYNWRDTVELAGSGMLGDMGSHLVDLARYVTGLEFESVTGTLYTLDRSDSSLGYSVTTDDETEFLAQLSHGVSGYFRISRIVRGESRSYLEVDGTKGALRVHYSRGNIDALYHCSTQSGDFTPVALPNGAHPEHNHALYKMLVAFVDECTGSKRHPAAATFADGHYTQGVLDAVIASSSAGQCKTPVRS